MSYRGGAVPLARATTASATLRDRTRPVSVGICESHDGRVASSQVLQTKRLTTSRPNDVRCTSGGGWIGFPESIS
jgi:hypothetical protein